MRILNEFDQRQLKIMLDNIQAFEEGNLHLSSLINNLESLLNLLNFEDPKWKGEFQSNWSTLEIIYASALDENKTIFDTQDIQAIHESILNLKNIILRKSQ